MKIEYLAIAWCVSGLVFGALGTYVAEQKGRAGAEGFFLGFLFAAYGVLILALMPDGRRR